MRLRAESAAAVGSCLDSGIRDLLLEMGQGRVRQVEVKCGPPQGVVGCTGASKQICRVVPIRLTDVPC